jgi:hypothetical protein
MVSPVAGSGLSIGIVFPISLKKEITAAERSETVILL